LLLVLFGCVFLGFAVKVPLIPFHTWLPSAYSEAPIGTTMMLTGLMSKMGVYGFVRIVLPLFQQEMRWVLTALMWLAVITIVYGALAAFAQRDIRRMFAYSSINHLGYCLLAIFAVARLDSGSIGADDKAAALSGAFLQLFNHGVTAAALFWFVGLVEARTGNIRTLEDFGGLRKVAPVFCGLMGITVFSSLGLPGLNGFVGEFLIFRGVFPLAPWAGAIALVGLLVTAVYLLTFLQRFFNGPLNPRWAAFPDLSASERLMLAPAIGLMFFLGVYPQAVLGLLDQTVVRMVERLNF
jgi:NADH-quinone oxidoreductase subunit M